MRRKLLHNSLISIAAAGAAFLVSSNALADDRDPYAPVTTEDDGTLPPLPSEIGVGMSVGGGFANFTNSRMLNMTDLGGNWTARLTLGTRSPIALEAAYLGTANKINSPGLDSNAVLVSNGVEGVLRLNILPNFGVQPYILGGLGWKRYSLTQDNFNNSDVRQRDDVLEVPVGAGIAFRADQFLIDGRFDYRMTFNEDLLPGMNRDSAVNGLENWDLSARVGFEF